MGEAQSREEFEDWLKDQPVGGYEFRTRVYLWDPSEAAIVMEDTDVEIEWEEDW